MTSLTYVFHNFIIIYHPFCFRKRVDIFPIYVSCHFFCHLLQPPFSRHGGGGGDCCFFLTAWGGGITVFFDNCEWGVANFFWHLKISPAPQRRKRKRNTKKSSVKREKCNRKRKKKENFVFLVLVLHLQLRLCQKSSSVKRQNVNAIVSARYKPFCLRRLCSSVKVLALAIVLTSLV